MESSLTKGVRVIHLRAFVVAHSGEIDHPICQASGAPHCEYHTRFVVESGAPRSSSALSFSDLLQIAYELGHCSSAEALADAIVELLHRRLGCRRVLIWARVAPDTEPRLLRTEGKPGPDALLSFVLQMGGHTVGKIEVEARSDGSEALIEQLLPCLALAMRDAGAGPDPAPERAPSPPRSHRGEVQRQLGRAAARWALTPRQTEVLAEVIGGATNKEIAGELACEEGTVEVHVSNVLKKSGAANRTGLISRLWSLS
ncbi:MAG: LuxR C-terminal-related transcriptional regulator [Byssovorax sp.]